MLKGTRALADPGIKRSSGSIFVRYKSTAQCLVEIFELLKNNTNFFCQVDILKLKRKC